MPDRSELLKRQKALADFGDFVLDHDDLQQVLDEGCRLVADALGADLAKILEIERTNKTALVRAGIGWKDGIVGSERISLSERSSEAYAIEHAEPVITNDIAQEKRFHFPSFLSDHGVVALVNVPIFLPGRRPWGVLQVDAREVRDFEQEDIEFLKTYSMVLGPVIDRLQKVEGLRESEHKYQTLFESIDEGLAIVEMIYEDGEITDMIFRQVNGAYERQTGIGDAVGRSIYDIVPGVEDHWIDIYKEVAATGENARLEHYQQDVDMWFDVHFTRVDEEGRFVAIVFSNTTVRKRAEAQVREAEERQAFLLRLADTLRAMPADQIIDCAIKMLFEKLALDLCYVATVFQDEDRADVFYQLRRGSEMPAVPPVIRLSEFPEALQEWQERTLVSDDMAHDPALTETDRRNVADMRFGALIAAPVRRGPGHPIWTIVAVMAEARRWKASEIALVEETAERSWAALERARADDAVRASEQQLRDVLDSLSEGFALIDPHFTILDVNAETLRLDGRPREAIVGQNHWDAFPGSEDSPQGEMFKRAMRDRRPEALEHSYTWPDGKTMWIDTRAYPTTHGHMAILWRDITDRKLADATLRQSEKRYEALFAASPAPVLILKPDVPRFTIADVNNAYLSATMRTREGLVGRDMFEAFPDNPDDPAADGVSALRASLEQAVTSRHPNLMGVQKYDVARPDGTFEERWWKPANAPVVDVDGKVVSIIHHVADVTSEHRAVQALRESEERFRRFGEASQDILWMRDAETLQWTYLTPAFEAIYGISREEAVQGPNYRRWLDLIIPEDRDHAEREIEKVRKGNRVTFEYRIQRPCDGKTCWLRETNFPISNDAGKISWIGGVAHNVTELRESEEQRRTSEERLSLIVENTRDYAIFTTDTEGRIDRWYVGAAAVFGWPANEAIGQLAEVTFTSEDREAGAAAGERAVAAQCGRAADVRWHQRKDGSRIFIDGVTTSLRDADGALTGFLKIGQDVTERRRAEDLQATLLAELQHRVRNLLAMIRSVLRRASIGKESVRDFVDHLEGRLDAMARTQAMLTRAPGRHVDLQAIVEEELLAQGADPKQYMIKGPATALTSKVAEIVTLAIHELTTNSVKYGALGRQGGFFFVTWSKEQRGGELRLTIRWRETGVPIEGKPRAGFGTELLTRRVPFELGGDVQLEFLPDGLTATLDLPLRQAGSVLQTDALVTAGE